MAGMAENIETKLRSAFNPSLLELQDVSESHRGHAGFQEGGESHWELVIAADALTGKSRVAQHRAIYAALGDVMEQIHALAITVR